MNYKILLEKLQSKSKLNLNDKEKDQFEIDLKNFSNSLKIFDKLDLNNIDESYRPFVEIQEYLRDDEAFLNNNENIFDNNSFSENELFILKTKSKENE